MFYLDLEDTIIKSWDNPTIINYSKIRNYLSNNIVKEIGIYSFAIHNEKDLKDFNLDLKEQIEELLQVKIVKVLTVPEIMKVVKIYENLKYDSMYDFIQMNGKYFSFLKFCQVQHSREISTLIDDAVPNSITSFSSPNCVIQTVNINNLK